MKAALASSFTSPLAGRSTAAGGGFVSMIDYLFLPECVRVSARASACTAGISGLQGAAATDNVGAVIGGVPRVPAELGRRR